MSGTETWVAAVPTAAASRYLQQLAKHWSHRFAVAFTPTDATIALPDGAVLTMAAEATTLRLTLTVPAGGDAARLRRVVEEHIDRFAHREGALGYDWRAEAATAAQ